MSNQQSVPPGAPDLEAYEPTDDDKVKIAQIVALLGANGEEFTVAQIRPFYPKVGRHILTAILKTLEESNLVTVRTQKSLQGGAWAVYKLNPQ